MPDRLIGQTLDNRYHFEAIIGKGTFANVYRITDQQRRVTLAAKVLHQEIARDTTFVERFKREADVLSRLQHPHIVRYYDIVEIKTGDDSPEYIFILMDYIPGKTLETILSNRQQPLIPQHSLIYVTPLAAALHYAHTEGVIHRDLKPANILLDQNDTLYITDFGIARILDQISELTLGMTIGTPLYMAPEQITGQPITAATDIYAFGVLLYEMYTGQAPFRGETSQAQGTSTAARVAYEHVHLPPRPLVDINPSLDLSAQEIVLRCLEKDPLRRYRSVAQLYDALTEAVGAPPLALEAPSDISLPEWSQFVAPVDNQSPVKKPPKIRIEHPAPHAKTRPHLDKVLEDSDAIAKPLAEPTLLSVRQTITRHPPYQEATAPPDLNRAQYPRPTHAQRSRTPSWFTRAIIVGILLVSLTICAAAAYLAGLFETGSRNTRAPATLEQVGAGSLFPRHTSSIRRGGTRFAFDSRRSGNLDIYVMNLDGTGLQQLTGTSGAERGPSWSPDGTQIAFYGAASEQSTYDIFLINVDGTNLRNLTRTPAVDERYPTWSPDGTQIAFHSDADGDYDIYTMNVDGSGLTAVTSNDTQDLGPDWSPDGTQIAFHTDQWGPPYEIAILTLQTADIRRVTDTDTTNSFATWSPDGTRLAYNAITDDQRITIYTINADGSSPQQITNALERDAFPDWSPDGTRIIYQSGNEGTSGIFFVQVTGGEPQALTGQQANFLPEWEPYYLQP
jgi:serine/threonine protein kinase/Tol biopolymer transport system component